MKVGPVLTRENIDPLVAAGKLRADDYIVCRDGPSLCEECRPSDDELARIRAIQAACPKHDPECGAQAEDGHQFCIAPETEVPA